MATDFFERQTVARRNTGWLVWMFLLAVIAIVGATFLATWWGCNYYDSYATALDQPKPQLGRVPIYAAVGSLGLIVLGSLYKIAELRGGGASVAEHLGGRRLLHDTSDSLERRLLNVVEEMAIASGVPVPPVYLLPKEQGINAFAAGYSPSDAVIGVTRGCAEQLSRDELQGVIAHEFSHILNGDMRLNIRLIGVLHGILLLGLIGELLFRIGAYSGGGRSRDEKGGGVYIILIGVALLIIGYLGTVLGNLIKAAVSRQREYLADSSAVQFTRNPDGLASALKQIGSIAFGSKITSPNAAEASHMFFSEGLSIGFTSLLATHPPLRKRILAIDPDWNGKFVAHPAAALAANVSGAGVSGLVGDNDLDAEIVPVEVVENASQHVGEPSEIHRNYAVELIHSLPTDLVSAAHEPYGARAVMFGLLLDKEAAVRQHQLASLAREAAPDVVELTHKLIPSIDQLDTRARLPLVDMCLPSLRAMAPSQYKTFRKCFQDLVEADNRLGLFEWSLHHILLRHLRPQFEKVRRRSTIYWGLQKQGEPCSVLLSSLAHVDGSAEQAIAAFGYADDLLREVPMRLLDPKECTLPKLQESLNQLAQVSVKLRRRVVDAAAACICADREVTVREAELLRAICDMLDCPMPPLLPGQKIEPIHAQSLVDAHNQ